MRRLGDPTPTAIPMKSLPAGEAFVGNPGTGAARVQRIVVVIGLILLAVITLNVNSATRIFGWPWWLLWRLTVAVPFILLLVSCFRPAAGRLPRALGVLLGGSAAVYLIAALASVHPAASIAYSASLLSICCLVVVVGRAPAALRLVPAGLAWGGVVYCGASVGAWIVRLVWAQWRATVALNAAAGAEIATSLPFDTRNSLLLGHWNYTAGVGVLALPWAIAFAWRARGWRRVAWLVGAALVFVAVQSAMSRGAWVGLAASGVFAVIVRAAYARWPLRRIGIGAGAAVVMALAVTLLIPRVRATALAFVSGLGFTLSDEQRLNMMQVGGLMLRDHPFIGQGPGLTPRLYPAYRGFVDGGIESAFQLHCTPLQLAVDAGLVAALGFGAVVLLALASTLQTLRRVRTTPAAGDDFLWARGVTGVSLAGYMVFALTDYQLDVPVIAAAVGASLGVLSHPGGGTTIRGRGLTMAVAVVALVGFVMITVPEARARRELAAGVATVERTGNLDALDEAAARTVDVQPDDPQPLVAAAVVHLRMSFAETDPAVVLQHQAAAVGLFTQALTIEPNLEIAHSNLGWLKLQSQPATAVEHFRIAQQLAPDRGGVYLGLGLARLDAGDRARAIDALALEALNEPRFVTSPRWDVPVLRELWTPVLRRAIAITNEWQGRAAPEQRARLAYLGGLFRWLLDGESNGLAEVALPEARSLFESISGTTLPEVAVATVDTPGWWTLAAAARAPERRDALLRQLLVSRLGRVPTEDEIGRLTRLVTDLGTDWRAWLNAPEGRDTPFALTRRNHRPAYATLAYNMDIPTPYDSYIVQENQLVEWFFAPVFPARGHLPETWLVEYVRTRDL